MSYNTYLQRALIAASTDFFNDYLTRECFAEAHGISPEAAKLILAEGKRLREEELALTGKTCGADNFKEYLAGGEKEPSTDFRAGLLRNHGLKVDIVGGRIIVRNAYKDTQGVWHDEDVTSKSAAQLMQ